MQQITGILVLTLGKRTLPRAVPTQTKPGILRRIFGAIFETRQEQIEREVARFVARSGGRITDDIERKINAALFYEQLWNARQ
jgi:hypothetical protein